MESINRAEDYRKQDENVGYEPTETIVVYMALMFSLQKQKSLVYLLR